MSQASLIRLFEVAVIVIALLAIMFVALRARRSGNEGAYLPWLVMTMQVVLLAGTFINTAPSTLEGWSQLLFAFLAGLCLAPLLPTKLRTHKPPNT